MFIGKCKSTYPNLIDLFEKYFVNNDIRLHFDKIAKIDADRVLGTRLILVHIESGIKCVLLHDTSALMAESSRIIRDFCSLDPIGKKVNR